MGLANTKVYNAWQGMIARTTRPNNPLWKYYGGRGIKVCKRWLTFRLFYQDMGEPPERTRKYSLGRENNDKGYCKSNCRWETQRQQTRNYRRNVWLTVDGVTMCAQDWSEISGIKSSIIRFRIKSGWSHKEAIFTKPTR